MKSLPSKRSVRTLAAIVFILTTNLLFAQTKKPNIVVIWGLQHLTLTGSLWPAAYSIAQVIEKPEASNEKLKTIKRTMQQ